MGANNFIIGEDSKGEINHVEVTSENEINTIDKKGNQKAYNIEDKLECILMELKEVVKQLKKINK